MENLFDELIPKLKKGTMISFKEYNLDRHERKKLTIGLDNVVIAECYPSNYTINREELISIYGEGLSDMDYLILSTNICPRYLVNLGINKEGKMDVKMISLNKDFVNMGFQEVVVVGDLISNEEPNYTLAQRGW